MLVLRSNILFRKTTALLRQAPRLLRRRSSEARHYRQSPPLVANSFPKSGTHLLTQVLEAFPQCRQYGTFWASTPSVSLVERSSKATLALINRVVPGELIPAHLFYAPEYQNALTKHHCMHFFIYRDLRDVAVSEAHYLSEMNRWHRLHFLFKHLSTMEERILFSITGTDDDSSHFYYPNIQRRFRRFAPWLGSPDVFSIQYEKLISDERETEIRRMIAFYNERTEEKVNEEEVARAALSNVNPQRSHTFHRGKAAAWRDLFTPRLTEEMKRIAGSMLVELGYEPDLNWQR